MKKEDRINRDVDTFVDSMRKKYGVMASVSVLIPGKKLTSPTLEQLEHAILSIMPEEYVEWGIRKKSRKRDYVAYRAVFSLIAYEVGHSLTKIARYLKQDHTTVIYSRDKCTDLLFIKDELVTDIYNEAKTVIGQY